MNVSDSPILTGTQIMEAIRDKHQISAGDATRALRLFVEAKRAEGRAEGAVYDKASFRDAAMLAAVTGLSAAVTTINFTPQDIAERAMNIAVCATQLRESFR